MRAVVSNAATCPRCDGSGVVVDTTQENHGREWETNACITRPCHRCDGAGELPTWSAEPEMRERYQDEQAERRGDQMREERGA